MIKKSLTFTLILGVVTLSALIYKKKNTVKFMILHTNDHHGHFWKNHENKFGMAARKTLIDKYRMAAKKEGRNVFLLSAGDINTGSFESDLLEAEPDFIGMNHLGYDAMALGNHEFDNPLEVTMKQKNWANFPFLSANIFYADSGERVFTPSTIFEREGVKVGIYGLTTEMISPRTDDKRQLEFRDPVIVAKVDIPKLAFETDLIIGLTHLGCYHDNPSLIDRTGDIHLVRNVPGFDMIIGGHSQIALHEPIWEGRVPIVQAKEYGEFLGKLEFEVFHGRAQNFRYELIPVENIEEDAQTLALLAPYNEKAKGLGERVIAKSQDFFVGKDRNFVRSEEAPLGNLIGAAYMAKTGADIAIVGGGAIRNDLRAGDITFKDVKEILPFGNTLTTALLSADELKNYLAPIVKIADGSKNGAFPQMSGIEVTVDNEEIIHKIKVGGLEISSDKKYKIVMDAYLAKREKLYPKLSEFSTFVDTGYVDYLSFIEYIQNKKIIYANDYAVTGDIKIEQN